MNNSAKFQLYPPYSFWEVDVSIFIRKFNISVAIATNQIKVLQQNRYVWTKMICLVEEHSTNISVKLLSKYLQWDSNKSKF